MIIPPLGMNGNTTERRGKSFMRAGARNSALSSTPLCTFLAVSVQNQGLSYPFGVGGPGA